MQPLSELLAWPQACLVYNVVYIHKTKTNGPKLNFSDRKNKTESTSFAESYDKYHIVSVKMFLQIWWFYIYKLNNWLWKFSCFLSYINLLKSYWPIFFKKCIAIAKIKTVFFLAHEKSITIVMDVCMRQRLCCWYFTLESTQPPLLWSLMSHWNFVSFSQKRTTDDLSFKWKKTAWNCHLLAKQTTICFCQHRWEQSAIVQ